MGSSTKKKREKRKDFQKPKLKVGKARPKPTNFTDTSFKSKVVLDKQSISTNAPSPAAQFSHHLSLLTSHSDSQRRNSLSFLVTALASTPQEALSQQPVSALLPKVLPLISDGSDRVRTQLLKLLKALPPEDVGDHVEQILPYVRVGITSLATEIQIPSLDVLEWLLEVCGNDAVSCAGGWVKLLKCLVAILGWSRVPETGGWSSNKALHGKIGSQKKLFTRTLNVLAALLRAGLENPPPEEKKPSRFPWVLRHMEAHMIPKCNNLYGHLNLFGPPRNEADQEYADRAERQRSFRNLFQSEIESGLEAAKKAEGEVGRAAAALQFVVSEGMKDYEEFDY